MYLKNDDRTSFYFLCIELNYMDFRARNLTTLTWVPKMYFWQNVFQNKSVLIQSNSSTKPVQDQVGLCPQRIFRFGLTNQTKIWVASNTAPKYNIALDQVRH